MATSALGILTPDRPNNYGITADLAAMANSIDAAILGALDGANVYKGTAAQRAAFLTTATIGQLWQDTDSIKMLWKKDGAVWVPAVSRWVGTTAQMNAFSPAPEGFEWYNTTDNRTLLRQNGSWHPPSLLGVAKKTSSQANIVTDTLVSGLNMSFTLPYSVDVEFSFVLHGYGTTADQVQEFTLLSGTSNLATWVIRANSGGQATYQSYQLGTVSALPQGTHSITVRSKRAVGSGGYTMTPTAANPIVLTAKVLN